MKRSIKALTALITAGALLSAPLPAFAAEKTQDSALYPNADKIPQNLYEAMEKAGDDELIGRTDDPVKPSSLIMYTTAYSDFHDIEQWFEWQCAEPILREAGAKWEQVHFTGAEEFFIPYDKDTTVLPLTRDKLYLYESPDDPYNGFKMYDDEHREVTPSKPAPKVPDGRPFFSYETREHYFPYLTPITRGYINLTLTKDQIMKLCENDDVICFSYENDVDDAYFNRRFMHYTSADALKILRTSLDLEGNAYFTDSEYPDALMIDVDHNYIADSSDALLALRDSVGETPEIYWNLNSDGGYDYDSFYPWVPRKNSDGEVLEPLSYYSVGREFEPKRCAADLVKSADRVVTARIKRMDMIEGDEKMESLCEGLSMERADDRAMLYTVYEFEVIEDHKNAIDNFDHSFVIFGGVMEPKYIANDNQALEYILGKQRELANGRKVPIMMSPTMNIGEEYVLLFRYDEKAQCLTLDSLDYNAFDTNYNEWHDPYNEEFVDGGDIIEACTLDL